MVVAQVPVAEGRGARRRNRWADSGEGGRLVLVPPNGKPRVLTASFHSAADPEVSFDGKSILFAGKKAASDPWCVFEMKADGTAARQITCGEAGARQPVYQSTIYTITPTNVEPWVQVAFVGENPGERNEAGVAPNTSLWSCKTDGTALRRLTYNLSNDRDPAILPDGRMVYAGWLRSPGREPADRVALLGVNEDGTDYQTYAGDQGLRAKRMPAPTANGLVVFVEADAVEGDGAGRLASVSQVRPLHSYRSLSAEGDGLFRSPSPLPDGRVLVAWRPATSASGIHSRERSGGLGWRQHPPDEDLRHPSLRPGDRGAREGVRRDGLALGPGEAPRAPPDARRALERRARRRPRGQALHDRRRHPGAGPGAAEGGREDPAGGRGRARDRRPAGGAAAPRGSPDRRGRLLPGAGPREHAGADRAPRRLRGRAAHVGLDLGAQPRGAGLRRLPRGPGAHAAEPADEGPSAPAPVLNPPPAERRILTDAPGGAGGAGCPPGWRAGLSPSPSAVRAFAQSIDAGGQP